MVDNPLIDAARGRDPLQQAEALRLAEFFESMKKSSHRWYDGTPVHEKVAAELRHQNAWIAKLKAQQERKPLDTRPVVSDDELAKAFAGTNFGSADHRSELHVAVLKKACGYHCGHTITTIMRELRLIGSSNLPTKKGRKLISLAYHSLMVGGP